MPGHHNIELRFLRSPTSSVADDDILKIVKLGENSVRIIYTEKSSDGTMIDVFTMTYTQLMAYLCRVFLLLGLDNDPFTSVNIAVPGYPIVLLSVSRLQQNIPHILEILMATCQSWPVIGRPTHQPAAAPSTSNDVENVD
jgi:hypothetical protein